MIAIIDYGVGNLKSIQKAVELSGADAVITSSYKDASRSQGLILPGVGAFAPAMKIIRKNRLDCALTEFVALRKPVLGICLGMQLLFESSEEGGRHKGIGFFSGEVRRLPQKPGLKIPQMGWNSVEYARKTPELFRGIKSGSYFYFVHSFACFSRDEKVVSGTTNYGAKFASSVESGSVFGLQFHPEKSGENGLKIVSNFCTLAENEKCLQKE